MQKLRTISKEEAFDSICFLETFEPTNESEERDINIAILALRRVIREREYYEAHREAQNERYRQKLQDPEYRKHKQERDRLYRQTHKEQIREKNRRYAQRHFKKTEGFEE